MKDSHVHTTISHDGISEMSAYIYAAREKGVDEITFTEHWDDYTGLKTDLRTLDISVYREKYLACSNEEAMQTNFGIEIGLQPDIAEKIQAVTNQYSFDYIIGSSHIVCKKDMAMDSSFFEGVTRKEAYMRYFSEVLENIKLYRSEFDVYGHLDYVVRYGGYEEKKICYSEFADILDEILNLLIKNDKGLEVNTSGIRYGLGYPHPNAEILKRYKELGGKIIVLGSDAHKTDDLARNFDIALELLKQIGFREVAVFHNRIPDFSDINNFDK